MIDELKVADHYRNLDLFDLIKNGLVKLGVSLDAVSITDLSLVDNFHVGGESATQFVIDHLHLDAEKSIVERLIGKNTKKSDARNLFHYIFGKINAKAPPKKWEQLSRKRHR